MSFENTNSDASLPQATIQPGLSLTEDPKNAYQEMATKTGANAANQPADRAAAGQSFDGALINGALVGLGSQLYGPALQEGAPKLANALSESHILPQAGYWLEDNVLRRGVGEQLRLPNIGEEPGLQEKIAQASRTFFSSADEGIRKGLTSIGETPWEAKPWRQSIVKGVAVGAVDYRVDSLLASTTGMSVFKPNIVDTSLVTAATISPIPGNYKLAAVAAGWSIGRISNLLGIT